MSDEDGFGVEAGLGLLAMVDPDEIVCPAEGDGFALPDGAEGSGGFGLDAGKGDVLEPGAVVAARLCAGERKSGSQVLGGEPAATDPYAAAFQEVAREELHVGPDAGGGNLLGGEAAGQDGSDHAEPDARSRHRCRKALTALTLA